MRNSSILALAAVSLGSVAWVGRQDPAGRVLDPGFHHLGNDPTPDWKEAARDPEGTRLDVRFESRANNGEWTLFLKQRSVDNPWRLKANGVEIARLKARPGLVEESYPVPAGALRDGENVLSFEPDVPSDDVVLGALRLVEASLREIYHLRPVDVRVVDADTGAPLPARVTFLDMQGQPAPLYYAEHPDTAVRNGILYVGNGGARVELPLGNYLCYATRGVEWSLSERTLTVVEEMISVVEHSLKREVDSAGRIACDTHIHTLQFSGHGDSSALERQVTLAGEGVELAIATDHNHNTDYGPYQRELGLTPYYTAVTGNEVTTKVGHFNGFPLKPTDAVPPHDLESYVQIVAGIRAKGAKVVILNHPRWPNHDDGPFGVHHLDHLLGRFDPWLDLPVDATEMINATTNEQQPQLLFEDWFALLNRGQRIFAVGSSDSHTVGDPVGQGRTYVPSATDDPAAIDVGAACDAIANGHTSISMGILASVAVAGRPVMGETLEIPGPGTPLALAVRVQAPGWVRPRKLSIFVDGLELRSLDIEGTPGRALDRVFDVQLDPGCTNDVWIVCVVTGDGVDAPYWKTLNPYTLAATNPVFVDRDGGGWSSARDAALALVQDPDANDAMLRERLATCDAAHVVHALDAWAELLSSAHVDTATILKRLTAIAGPTSSASAPVAAYLARY